MKFRDPSLDGRGGESLFDLVFLAHRITKKRDCKIAIIKIKILQIYPFLNAVGSKDARLWVGRSGNSFVSPKGLSESGSRLSSSSSGIYSSDFGRQGRSFSLDDMFYSLVARSMVGC